MKQEVQLYIDGQRVDLFNDETILINSSIKNVKDVASVFMTYSQGFNVPASRNNNKIFKHYYENLIVNGFDARLKVDAEIEINYVPFKKGKIQLNAVKLKNNKPHSYDLTFFDDTISLKDVLGDDLLSDLDFSEYNTIYSSQAVVNLLQSGTTVGSITDAIICPMISAEQRWYYNSSEDNAATGNLWAGGTALRGAYWDNFKYAIRLYAIIKKIEESYPEISFLESDFFSQSNPDLYNLYMWLNRERGVVQTSTIYDFIEDWGYNSTQGFSTIDTGFTVTLGSTVQSVNVTLNLNTGGTAEIYDIILYKNGNKYATYKSQTGNASVDFGSLGSGYYQMEVAYVNGFTIFGNDLSETNLVAEINSGGNSFTYYTETDLVLGSDIPFSITQNMPEMKVIDFITGLFKMFNLVAYKEGDYIRVRHLDEYYANFDNTFDLNKYVDVSETEVRPNKLYSTIEFKYSGLESYITQKHNEQFNYEWGTEKYTLSDNYEGDTYIVEAPFEHLKLEKLYDQDVTPTSILWGMDGQRRKRREY